MVLTEEMIKDLPLITEEELREIKEIYEKVGYPIMFVSAKEEEGIDAIRELLKGKTTTVAGPSGVGKSSIINLLQDNVVMETGEISEKIERGKHTTRHVELFRLDKSSNDITDTPGFTSLSLLELGIGYDEIILGYPELIEASIECKFDDCRQINEKSCNVLNLLGDTIDKGRYERYKEFYLEAYENRNNYSLKIIKWREKKNEL